MLILRPPKAGGVRRVETPKHHLIARLHLPIVWVTRDVINLAAHVPDDRLIDAECWETFWTRAVLNGRGHGLHFLPTGPRFAHLAGDQRQGQVGIAEVRSL